jgi:hypothetical protein
LSGGHPVARSASGRQTKNGQKRGLCPHLSNPVRFGNPLCGFLRPLRLNTFLLLPSFQKMLRCSTLLHPKNVLQIAGYQQLLRVLHPFYAKMYITRQVALFGQVIRAVYGRHAVRQNWAGASGGFINIAE